MTQELAPYPHVVYLYSKESRNMTQVLASVGLSAPLKMTGFTDTHPKTNPYNERLIETVSACDILIIQKQLLLNGTVSALEAFGAATKLRESDRKVFLVDNDHALTDQSFFAGMQEQGKA